jgi:RNA polymerase sigma factor (sigma-70 family)
MLGYIFRLHQGAEQTNHNKTSTTYRRVGMMSAREPRKRSLLDLVEGCRHQANQKEKTNHNLYKGFCLELFRRAIEEQNDAAWEHVRHQYHKLIIRWVQRSATTSLSLEDVEDLVQDAFLKFWRTIGRRPEQFSEKFNHIGSVLRYLQQCAASACIDFQRKQSRQIIVEESLQQEDEAHTKAAEFKGLDLALQEQMQQLREWIAQSLTDEDERLIIYHSFYDGWSPKKIYTTYPERFAAVEDVRKIKVRVMKRAKRAFRN